MRIIPVLDLKQGQVVRAVAGRRHEYRPIVSRLTLSCAPADVARALQEHFGFQELYVADLDAIGGQEPALTALVDLLQGGFRLWVDAGTGWGCRTLDVLAAIGVSDLIAGLESLAGPQALRELLDRFGDGRVVFSLDLRDGRPLGSCDAWNFPDAWVIAQQAVQLGTRRVLVLDLAGVGVNQGTRTDELCARLRTTFPHIEISTGGGVRGREDLERLRRLGVNAVLIASALHDGRLTRKDVEEYSEPLRGAS